MVARLLHHLRDAVSMSGEAGAAEARGARRRERAGGRAGSRGTWGVRTAEPYATA